MAIYKKKTDYYIDYYANGRRIREKVGSSKTLAENVLRKRKLAIAENRFLDVRKQNKIKFEEVKDIRKSFWTACKESVILNVRFHGLKYTFTFISS